MVTMKKTEFQQIMEEFKSIKKEIWKSDRRTTFILLLAAFFFCSGPFMDKDLTLAFLAIFIAIVVVAYALFYKIKLE